MLDFSNASFDSFFRDTAGIDIYSAKYDLGSGSKANRLRAFWEREGNLLVGTVLTALLELYVFETEVSGGEVDQKAYETCKDIAARLKGKLAESSQETDIESFLAKDFGKIDLDKIPIEATVLPILKQRLNEASTAIKNGAPLSAIFMCGSVLEGALLGVAQQQPKLFNSSPAAPKDKSNKVLQFPNWSLSQFIDVAHQVGILKTDVQKFSHVLRDFRNYIHPFQQMSSGFSPNEDTAKICMQVLRAALNDLCNKR